MPTEGGHLREPLTPAVESLPGMLYRGTNGPERPLSAVSSGVRRICGYDRGIVESGDVAWTRDVVHPEDRAHVHGDVRDALDTGDDYDLTYRIVTAEDAVRWVRDRGERLPDGSISGYVEDVTLLKERERRLEAELDETLERVSDGFLGLDREWRITYINDHGAELLGHDPDELHGKDLWEAFPEAGTTFEDEYEWALNAQETVTFTEYYPAVDAHFEVSAYPSETGLSVYFRDVSERVERERQLERHEAIVETVWDGVYAIDENDRFTLVNDAYCELLGVERGDVMGRQADEVLGEGVVREARRFTEEMRGGERDAATLSFAIDDGDGGKRTVEARFGPFPDGGRVGVLRDVTMRRERQYELRRQRERLSWLVDLYDVASDVSNAVLEETSRAGVEELVAERLAESGYTAAWVGRTSGTDVSWTATAGDGDVPAADDLAAEAIDAGEVVVRSGGGEERVALSRSVSDGGTSGWATAAVPVSYGGGTYSVLAVHATSADAFDDAERTVLGRLGTTIGHAIAALDRKAALLSEHVVQVEYRSRSVASDLGVGAAGELRFERTVATGDGAYVHYVRVSGLDADAARATFEDAAPYDRVRVVGEHDGDVLVEVSTREAHITTAVADHGGRLNTLIVEGGEARVVAEFPQGVDLRTATESIREVVPDVELVAQRSVTRDDGADSRADALSHLTDRQRAAFESAYYGGYFEWPRDSTAEDLAAAMGVSAPTFHQHLRAAERKLLGAYAK